MSKMYTYTASEINSNVTPPKEGKASDQQVEKKKCRIFRKPWVMVWYLSIEVQIVRLAVIVVSVNKVLVNKVPNVINFGKCIR